MKTKELEELIIDKLIEEVKVLNIEMCQELFQMLAALKDLYPEGSEGRYKNED